MPQVTYINKDGKEYIVDVDNGGNLMQAAVDNRVPGIMGDCGGDCACATCHVYVDPQWQEAAGSAGELEAELLDGLMDPEPTSRLGCQVVMSDELNGIIVRIPESQF
ncbi:MAG: 2Fe-2S iron-sulfur cluster binding domain-containing protein [Spongiibacteraceae bacterium]|nr:2Fe-2S iron-sulfur cluster binding domain-containing protein [Spongiibacteraceae bacterium]